MRGAERLFPLGGVERKLDFPTDTEAEERIAGAVSVALPADLNSGLAWYGNAYSLCQELASKYKLPGVSAEHVAGIMAALSPMRSWQENIQRTEILLAGGDPGGLRHTIDTAMLIRHGFDPVLAIGRTGQNYKVRSFFHNIAYFDTSTDVTVDRHMWTLLFNDLKVVKKADLYFQAHEYEWAAERFRAVAACYDNMLPHQAQAIAWLSWRRQQGIVDPADNPHQGTLELQFT